MPVDFSLLMGASPPSAFMPIHNYTDCYQLPGSFDPDIPNHHGGLGWRRNITYPLSRNSELCATKPTSFKLSSRSLSEMALPEASMSETTTPQSITPPLSSSAPVSSKTLEFELESLRVGEVASATDATQDVAESVGGTSCVPGLSKRVRFSDELGLDLCDVRVMTEPSDVPPKLSASVLRALLGEAACEEARPCATWHLSFAQPASDYLKFRQTLEAQSVALENVILRNEECALSGTIKVRNLCFKKEVMVRLTDDGWSSYRDYPATYTPPSHSKGHETFETFSFRIQVPCDDAKRYALSFAVVFRAEDGREFWDSNQGANFLVVSGKRPSSAPPPPKPQTFTPTRDPYALACSGGFGTFSAWRDLVDDCPYY